MNCEKHPDYKGVYPPRVRCKACRMSYTEHQLQRLPVREIANKLGVTENTVVRYIREMGLSFEIPPQVEAIHEAEVQKKADALRKEKQKAKGRDARIDELEAELEAVLEMRDSFNTYTIKPNGSIENEAVAVAVASDWHIEELVTRGASSGLNEFNERVCQERVLRFWRHTVKLLKKEQKACHIDTLVLALLGDFITGSIHDDLVETNRCLPTEAIIEAESHIASGIQYLLDQTDVNLVIPCCSGNHGRMTKKQRIAAELGNSLEQYMYHHLKQVFENEERVKFVIQDGYHIYLDVLGWTLRFHHGHAMRYYGAISGIYLSVNRSIGKWNKARKADYDVFG